MPDNETTADDDTGWWEQVFDVEEQRHLVNNCDRYNRQCFECLCRKEAIEQVSASTGVNYATDE